MAVKTDVVFRRLHGKIIPMRQGASGVYHASSATSHQAKVRGAAGAVGLVAGAAVAQRALAKPSESPQHALKFASTALAVAGGIAAGLPFGGGFKGLAVGTGIGLGLDVASTAANATAASRTAGNRRDKIKAFAKQEVINQAAGWGAMGATLLANPAVRKKLVSWGSTFLSKVVK